MSALADTWRAKVPRTGPARPFVLPQAQAVTLPDGAGATFVDFGTVPKVTLAIVIRAARVDEGDRTWLSLLTAELLKHGTRRRGPAAVADLARELGGTLDVRVTEDETFLSLEVLSEHAPQAVGLLAEMVSRPLLDPQDLPLARANLAQDLSVRSSYQGAVASSALLAALYPAHPYGVAFPTADGLESHTIDDVRSFHAANFCAQRVHMYAVGKFDAQAVEAALGDALADWQRGAAVEPETPPLPGLHAVRLIDRPGSTQCSVQLGLRVPAPQHRDFAAVSLLDGLLGGLLTSRITMNLRERRGWTYSPASYLTTAYHQAKWIEFMEVRPDVAGTALQEILREVELLRHEPPGAGELAAVRNHLHGSFVMSNATRQGLLASLAFVRLQGLPASWLASGLERLNAVTPQGVTEAAQRYFDPRSMAMAIAGDLDVIRPQIQALQELGDVVRELILI